MHMAYGCFYVCCSDCVAVCRNVCCVATVVEHSRVFSLGVLKYTVCLCKGCDRCWVSVCIVRCGAVVVCVWEMSVSSCICCMFLSCVHHVAVLNDVFCMICSLLMLVEDARGDHMEEAYSRAGLKTAL